MGMPVIESYTTSTTEGSASSITMTKPTGVESGDLLLMLMGNENSASGEGFDELAGWTLHFNYGSTLSDQYLAIYTRISDGDSLEDSPVVPFRAGGNDDGHGWYMRVTGQHGTNPIRVIGLAQEYGGTSSVTVDALTTDTNDDSLAISTVAYDGNDGKPFTETGTGWTLTDYLQSPLAGGGGGGSSSSYSLKEITTPLTTTGTSIITATGGNDGMLGTMFIIAGAEATGSDVYGECDVTSSTTLSVDGERVRTGEVSVSSTSSLIVGGQVDKSAGCDISSTTTLEVNGTVDHATGNDIYGEVDAVSTTVLSVVSSVVKVGATAIIAASVLSVAGVLDKSSGVDVVSTTLVDVTPTSSKDAIVNIAATSTLNVIPSVDRFAHCFLTREVLYDENGDPLTDENGDEIYADESITVVQCTGSVLGLVSVDVISTSTLDVTGTTDKHAEVDITSSATLNVTSSLDGTVTGSVDVIGTATLDVTAALDKYAEVDIISTSTLGVTASSDGVVTGSVDVVGTATLDVTAVLDKYAEVDVTSSTLLDVSGDTSLGVYGVVDITSNASLNVTGSSDSTNSININSSTVLDVSSSVVFESLVNITGSAVLTVRGIISSPIIDTTCGDIYIVEDMGILVIEEEAVGIIEC